MGSTRVRIPPKGKLVFSCLVEKRERKMEMISQHTVHRWRFYTHTDLFGGLPSALPRAESFKVPRMTEGNSVPVGPMGASCLSETRPRNAG